MANLQVGLRRAAWALVLLVAACAGGPGAALDGGGPGGPVGGGNYAAGPVSLPSSANAPLNPVEWAEISCVNLPGPEFNCSGRPRSVPANTKIEFRIFAAAAATPRDSYSAVADGEGSWTVSRAGVPGESVEICPIINGACYANRYVVIPPENVGVEAIQGTGKSLVIDSQGRSWHSRLLPKPARSWMSWIIGEAHAEVSPTLVTAQCRGVGAEPEVVSAESAKCHLYSQMPDNLPKIELSFDSCSQSDISSIVPTEDPTTHEALLLVAVRRSIYVVKIGSNPQILRRYNFPGAVTAILPQGNHFSVLVAAPDRPLFYLDLRNRDTPQEVGCYDLDDDLKGLKQVTSSDTEGHHFALAGFFENEGVSEYRVLVGAYVAGGTSFSQLPVTLIRSASPMEVRILDAKDSSVIVAVLQNAEKKLTFIRHPYFVPGVYYLYGATPTDTTYEVPMASLSFNRTPYTVQRPSLLEVDPDFREIGFVDFTEAGTKLVTIPYDVTPSMSALVESTVVTEIGRAAPVFLQVDRNTRDGSWIYGGQYGQVQTLKPIHNIIQLDAFIEGS
ncbi:MAG TPA: hypothetical protein VJP40_07840 [bacterium]|nr:hypothetical protein [bacterium]